MNGHSERWGNTKRRHPTASANDAAFNEAELEFMFAMDRYKRMNQRPFPTWSEVLAVLLSLGYTKGPTMNPSEITRQDDPSKVATCPHCGSSIPRADLPVTIPDPEDDEESDDDTPDFEE